MVSAPPALRAIAIGPTWRRDEGGQLVMPPMRSLGHRMIPWARKWLRQPDGPNARAPWEFTPEQSRFLCWWYELDEHGRFVNHSGCLRRSKGWGKNPFADVLCAIEFVGPCRPTGKFDAHGIPYGEAHYSSWVQAAAVSRDQTRNSMTLFPALFSQEALEEFQIDLGKEIIYAHRGRCRIEAVTSSPRSLEGGRATFTVMDETHHWLRSNEGHAMADVIARNAAKSRDGSSRRLAITNAHAPGEDSVAEHDYDAWRKIDAGLSPPGFLYDSLEAPEGIDLADDEQVRQGIELVRGDSVWLDVNRLHAEVRDPRTSEAMTRRFYLNQIHAEEDRPFDMAKWATLAKPGQLPADGALVTLGFDGSLSRDHTALIGTEVLTRHQWVVGYWEPEPIGDGGKLQIDFAAVNDTVSATFERWNVWRMNADPYKWGTHLAQWKGRFGADVVRDFATTAYRRMAIVLQQYQATIANGQLSHDGDPRFTAALANSHKHMQEFRDDDQERMWTIQKERPDSPLKIDAAIAGALSHEAAAACVAAGASEPTTSVYDTRGLRYV